MDANYGEPAPLLVERGDACRLLSIGLTKLNELCNAGDLDRRHIGRKAVITMESITAFIERLKAD